MSSARVFATAADAVADILNWSTVMVAGHRGAGVPEGLVRALVEAGATDLTCICGSLGGADPGTCDASVLVAGGRVRRLVTGGPAHPGRGGLSGGHLLPAGVEVDIVPPGSLVERVRAAGAGLGGVLLPIEAEASTGSAMETCVIDGATCRLEAPLAADFALLRARMSDTLGNLVYRRSERNWNPVMAQAARVTIAEVDEVVQPGELDPELIITPGVYVNRVVAIGGRSIWP